jgi:5S rRNA maturation endonuclease (ribonuclease M5)
MYSEDGQVAICQRIEEGSKKRCGDAGFLHVLVPGAMPKHMPHRHNTIKPVKDFTAESDQWRAAITDEQTDRLSTSLGVTAKSLRRLCVGFDGQAYTFPMRDEKRRIIGIRRRFEDGRKLSVKESTNALFIPEGLSKNGRLIICEGPTDCAAGLDMGFDAIGRPNCDSKIEMTTRFAEGRLVTIVADNDTPGIEGARKLARKLIRHCPEVKIIVPPAGIKDLRQWKQQDLSIRICK